MSGKTTTKAKRVNFACQLVASAQSPYWSVLKYYQSVDPEKSKQMMLQSLIAYWLPQDEKTQESDATGGEVKQEVKEAIYCLQQQINWLQGQFSFNKANKQQIEPLGYQNQEEITFSFRYQIKDPESGQFIQRLLKSRSQISLEQKILWSSVAYWGVIADRELGLLDQAGLNQSAANCLIRLRQHIEYLEDYFQLKEVPTVPVVTLPNSWGVSAPSNGNGSTETGVRTGEEEEEKDVSQTELDPDLQRLLRGDPESDKFMTEMFASL